MAEAADFSMADAFAKDYLDRIIKKTEKSLDNTCILYIGRKAKSGYTVIDVRLPGHSRFVPMHVHRLRYNDSHTLYSTESRKLSCVSFMSLKNLC